MIPAAGQETRAPAPAEADRGPLLSPALVACLALATLAKLLLLATTVGTDDALAWHRFAIYVLGKGPVPAYAFFGRELNHPPLGLLLVSGSLRLGRALGLPFGWPFWVRLPALAGDLLGTLALARLLERRVDPGRARAAIAAFALSPLAASAGLFHGNTDLLWVAVAFLAADALERGGPARAGVLLGVAAAIKLPALVALAPLGVVAWRDRSAGRLLLGLVAAVLVLFGPLTILAGRPFVEDVAGYRGTLTDQPWPPSSLVTPLFGPPAVDLYLRRGGLVVLAAVAAVSLSVVGRGRPGTGLAVGGRPGNGLALALGVALLLAPTFGAQYLAWFALPAAVLGLRACLAFHAAAAAQALAIYVSWGALAAPHVAKAGSESSPIPAGPAVVTWLVLLGVVVAEGRALFHGREGREGGEPRRSESEESEERTGGPD